jgi:serine/threonine protein phosphatase PrpC
MLKVKDTLRATVHLAFDGRVFKTYHGKDAATRFANEVRVLRHLEARGCGFVPRLLEADENTPRIVTSNCGQRVELLDEDRRAEIFAELEKFGVRHDDPDVRNVTYRFRDGRFCVIDFEFATLLPENESPAWLRWSGCTDAGRFRTNNEDAFLGLQFDAQEVFRLGKFGAASSEKSDFAFAVCDGMGGAKAGEFASNIAVEKITRLLPRTFRKHADHEKKNAAVLEELFRQIHRALVYLGGSYEEIEGMQTTMSLGWFSPGKMFFGHIGDSRIYHLPAKTNDIRQLTADDTHVGWLFRTGQINEREARTHPRRNVLQKALGGANQFVNPQVGTVACARGDIFLFCSDGLVDGLYDHELVELLRTEASDDLAKKLVDASVKNSGRDNTTALVVRVT